MILNLALTPIFLLASLFFCAHPNEWMLDGGIGYRTGTFDWNIGAPNRNPDVLSELSWKNLHMVDLFLEGDWKAPLGIYVKTNGELGLLVHGENRDSDFAKSHRKDEYCRSVCRSDRGYFTDASIGVGRDYMLRFFPITLYPLVGYSFHYQSFLLHDGKQVIGEGPDHDPHLRNKYWATWQGPWLGVDGSAKLSRFVYVRAGGEYHFATYRGRGRWSSRPDLPKDFHHKATSARGETLFASVEVGLGGCLTCGLMGRYQCWHAGKGKERGTRLLSFADQWFPSPYKQVFNEANLTTTSLIFTVAARF